MYMMVESPNRYLLTMFLQLVLILVEVSFDPRCKYAMTKWPHPPKETPDSEKCHGFTDEMHSLLFLIFPGFSAPEEGG